MRLFRLRPAGRLLRLLSAVGLFGAMIASLPFAAIAQGPISPGGSGQGEDQVDVPELPLIPVLIAFRQPPGLDEVAAVAFSGGVIDRGYSIVPAVAARVPIEALPGLMNHPSVAAVEPDGEFELHSYANVWGVNRINARSVHEGTFVSGGPSILGTGVKVAVVDTGIDYTHPELAGAYRGGYDFVNNDADPRDDHYHGTHVAGTIAAALNGTGVVGVAPGVDLYGLKVLSNTGSGSFSAIIASLDWCVANGIQVANFSLGSSGDPGTTVRAAFDNALAAGLTIVCSAGNSGTTNTSVDNVGYPAKYDSVIAVASTTSTDARSSFSSTGPAVDVAAPGSSVYSTYPGGGYATLSGTSMAAPHAAGAAALVIAGGIADANANGRINDDVQAVLMGTAIDLGATGTDWSFGAGLIQADLAVEASFGGGGGGGGGGGEIFDAPSGLAGSANTRRVVSLRWTDNSNVEEGFQIRWGTRNNRGVTTWRGSWNVAADATSSTRTMSRGTWQFQVRAFRGTEVTDWSNQIQVIVR